MMVGIGYISRAEGDEGNGAVETSLKKQNYMPVAERDLHEILTEAIAIGKQGGPREGEIIIGLDRYKPSAKSQPQPVWLQNPRFSHLIMRASNNSNGTTNTGEDNLRAKVLAANGAEHAIEILQTQFTTYLAYALKVSSLSHYSFSNPLYSYSSSVLRVSYIYLTILPSFRQIKLATTFQF